MSSRNEIWLDGTKQNPERKRKRNEAANLMFFVIGLPSCFPLPCFATGCHTFGLKIATAALRPRNDKIGTVLFVKRTFSIFAVIFFAVSLRIVFQTFRSGNCSVFRKTYQICHCEERQRRGNLKRNETASRNEIWLDGTKQNLERKRKRNEAANLMFFVIGLPSCFPLPCFATGCHTFGLKIATAALRPRNDTKLKRFYLRNKHSWLYAGVFEQNQHPAFVRTSQ